MTTAVVRDGITSSFSANQIYNLIKSRLFLKVISINLISNPVGLSIQINHPAHWVVI